MIIPDVQETKRFWTVILGQLVEHNQEKTCLREIKKDMNGKNKQARAQYLQEKLLKKNIDEN